ncbi:fatty acid desaturase family protein [Dendronalium sp. ChiSLP03b]|uniref:fatty acid desaturase family protein n=1 Tax=Dendronalium sp. ChiSLP03b TaxID=3075381 RepID=UPI002AD40F89|nr:fatty acid desaturase [Dendronalium sp. ChiSLP03b]MDZ8206777.1 fatty acid desaturase [Dendronalium sp. ChiSLP03b]
MFNIIVYLVTTATALSVVDYIYHFPEVVKINKVPSHSMTSKEIYHFLKSFRAKKYDNLIGVLPMMSNVLLCIASVLAAKVVNHLAFDLLCMLFIAGRFRSLEELGHMAIHGSVSPSEKLNFFLANVFFQFPLFKPNSLVRRQRHCVEHHPNVNLKGLDPGLQDFYDIGFVPNISERAFWAGVFYPLTPSGIKTRLKGCLNNVLMDVKNLKWLTLRLFCVTAVIAPYLYYGMYYELVMFYLLPLIFIFPQFYWLSQVVEHRWFINVIGKDRLEREMSSGRPTDYPGIIGLFWKTHLFPIGDSYHMAHSLFPHVRWNYLPAVDRLLKRNLPDYSERISVGLFLRGGDHPSALSDLREQMVVSRQKAETQIN